MDIEIKKPQITHFKSPEDYILEMINFLKHSENGFSVAQETKTLRKVSPTLVSLILKGKRKLTLDRIDEFSKLLRLNVAEKFYLKNWIEGNEPNSVNQESAANRTNGASRKEVSVHILNDWLNLYVKDCFEIKAVQKNPNLIFKKLANIAPPSRIQKSLNFLLKHGYLRRTSSNTIVLDTPLTVTDPKVCHQKIRNFHKNALKLARTNMDLFPATERFANTATIALNSKKYAELVAMIEEFSLKFQKFSESCSKDIEDTAQDPIAIYQLLFNLSPTGGKQDV